MIQNLRNQIKSDTELVKSAKKAESKLESLSYTNSLLVRQLLQEQDRLKAVQAQAVKEAAVRVQEPEVQVEQERVHLKIQTDSQLDLKNESIEVVSKDARIASLEADVRALEGELECAKLWVEQHSEAASQAEERSRNSIKTVENQNLALMEEVRQCSDKLVAKEEEIDRLVEELFVAQIQQSKASNASDNLSSVDSVDSQDAGKPTKALLPRRVALSSWSKRCQTCRFLHWRQSR